MEKWEEKKPEMKKTHELLSCFVLFYFHFFFFFFLIFWFLDSSTIFFFYLFLQTPPFMVANKNDSWISGYEQQRHQRYLL